MIGEAAALWRQLSFRIGEGVTEVIKLRKSWEKRVTVRYKQNAEIYAVFWLFFSRKSFRKICLYFLTFLKGEEKTKMKD